MNQWHSLRALCRQDNQAGRLHIFKLLLQKTKYFFAIFWSPETSSLLSVSPRISLPTSLKFINTVKLSSLLWLQYHEILMGGKYAFNSYRGVYFSKLRILPMSNLKSFPKQSFLASHFPFLLYEPKDFQMGGGRLKYGNSYTPLIVQF